MRHVSVLLLILVIGGAATAEWYVSRAEEPDEVTCTVPEATPDAEARWVEKAEGKQQRKAHENGGDEQALQETLEGESVLTRLRGIPEASGLALSHRTPGVLWTFNDSDDPAVYALDRDGAVRGHVVVQGVQTKNWEDISVGPCGSRSCLYIADIGDNHQRRDTIAVYRVAEPAPTDRETAPADAFIARYPDFPHDAEAMFVTPDEGLFIVTKDKPAAVYRFPEPLQPGRMVTLQQVGLLPMGGVTDAETSPDGVWVGMRSKEEMLFFRTQPLTSGRTEHGTPINLRGLHEPQGEGIAIAGDGTVFLASEGGNKDVPGTFTSVKCRFPAAGHRGP